MSGTKLITETISVGILTVSVSTLPSSASLPIDTTMDSVVGSVTSVLQYTVFEGGLYFRVDLEIELARPE